VNKNNSRWLELLLSMALSVFPVVVVAWAEQVVKTTLVRDLCKVPKRRHFTLWIRWMCLRSRPLKTNQPVFG
jgi:hypothetical protein